jgi:hypothetical protein
VQEAGRGWSVGSGPQFVIVWSKILVAEGIGT